MNIQLHQAKKPILPNTYLIYCHGLTRSRSSIEFDQCVVMFLSSNIGLPVLSFDFDYITKSTDPSSDVSDEVKQLKNVIETAIKEYQTKWIIIVGKSFGGVVALALARKHPAQKIQGIFILGLPMKLGFPPQIQLLREQKEPDFDYTQQYRDLMESGSIPIVVIQGDQDDLGIPKEIENVIANRPNATMRLVVGAGII